MERRSATAHGPAFLLVTHHFWPETGAPQRRWGALSAHLVRAGFGVTVLAPPPHYPSGKITHSSPEFRPGAVVYGPRGEKIIRVGFREHTLRLLSRAADQAIAALSSMWHGLRPAARSGGRPDVIIATVPGIPSVAAGWVLARCYRAALVIEMRDAWPDLIVPSGILAAPNGRTGLRRRVRAAIAATVHRVVTRLQARADLVVTTTDAFAEVLRARDVARVAVVRNGTAFEAVRSPAPARLDGRALRVLYAGTVGRSQGLDVVVRAAARVKERGYPIEVRVVGHGNDLETLGDLADRLRAPVSVSPPVPATRMRDLYAWADTAVVSLRDWEPFRWTVPSKLYEVMASGLPVTACLDGEAALITTETGAGSVVPPGDADALAALWCGWLADGVVPAPSPDAAAWVAANASDDVLGEKYETLLRHLVDGDAPPGAPASGDVTRASADEASADLLGDAVADALRTKSPTRGSRR
ncbi:glycosyltransferase family 4 protein [Myceligenerans pegani]|uniref:D-inositol 3-phosphate glycosyltransferase n=1 Tax=Myceligenerans pegani TaxID=2776917 RepID=A0ABR9N1N6_9MICO|nr:glycosyltransferase family 4 protein [Myceligenerans sp. TRM 65318]MBE1877131.1 glycosyltransferase family 4 protein [Myceligenerans sp. TRM 65318]MBE3019402.1 glycosyltransferase family 4 protein [Myceligenerans sp. TRM 65318]